MLETLYHEIFYFIIFFFLVFSILLMFDTIKNTPTKRAHIRYPIGFFIILLIMVLLYFNIIQKIEPNDFLFNIISLLMWGNVTKKEYKNSRMD